MGKILVIVLTDKGIKLDDKSPLISINVNDMKPLEVEECKHILTMVDDEYPTEKSVTRAINILINYFYATDEVCRTIDITDLNRQLAPPTEMTVAEIEKELGYKVKIVKEKEE